MDIAVSASTDRHALLKNDVGLQRNWLQVELAGTRSNRDAVGARITLSPEESSNRARSCWVMDTDRRTLCASTSALVISMSSISWSSAGRYPASIQIFENVAVKPDRQDHGERRQLATMVYPAVGQREYVTVSR